MKRQMSCDDVFEILTRGPFPNGDGSDHAVELHLVACHECRQLAEALRPAVDLFHETVPSTELDDLPGYHGSLRELRVATPPRRAAATFVASSRPKTSQRQRWTNVWSEFALARFAAAMALGAAVCVLCWGLGGAKSPNANQPLADAASHSRHKIWPSEEGWELLRSLDLPKRCLPQLALVANSATHPVDQSPALPVLVAVEDLACCTRCHSAANGNSPPLHSVAALAQSCRGCHVE